MSHTIGCATRPISDAGYEEIFDRIAAAGYSDVALFRNVGIGSDSTDAFVSEVARAAERAGVVPSMLIAGVELDADNPVSNYRRLIDHASRFGSRWILDLGLGDTSRLDTYIEVMREVVEYASRVGIGVSTKPHGGVTLTRNDLISLHDRIGHEAYSICFDPGNIIYYTKGAERPETEIESLAPIVRTVIIKDCVIRDGTPDVNILPGSGLVDFDAVLGGLVAGGFTGPLYVECVGGDGDAEIDANLRKANDFVKGVLARL